MRSKLIMDPRLVVEAFDRAVDTGDIAALDALCHPEMVTHSFGPTTPQGIQGLRRFVSSRRATGGVGRWDDAVVVSQGEYVVQFGTRTFNWRVIPRLRRTRSSLQS
jgi:ketosteroid isomerase-like protein